MPEPQENSSPKELPADSAGRPTDATAHPETQAREPLTREPLATEATVGEVVVNGKKRNAVFGHAKDALRAPIDRIREAAQAVADMPDAVHDTANAVLKGEGENVLKGVKRLGGNLWDIKRAAALTNPVGVIVDKAVTTAGFELAGAVVPKDSRLGRAIEAARNWDETSPNSDPASQKPQPTILQLPELKLESTREPAPPAPEPTQNFPAPFIDGLAGLPEDCKAAACGAVSTMVTKVSPLQEAIRVPTVANTNAQVASAAQTLAAAR